MMSLTAKNEAALLRLAIGAVRAGKRLYWGKNGRGFYTFLAGAAGYKALTPEAMADLYDHLDLDGDPRAKLPTNGSLPCRLCEHFHMKALDHCKWEQSLDAEGW